MLLLFVIPTIAFAVSVGHDFKKTIYFMIPNVHNLRKIIYLIDKQLIDTSRINLIGIYNES